jgi:hypothetical protein
MSLEIVTVTHAGCFRAQWDEDTMSDAGSRPPTPPHPIHFQTSTTLKLRDNNPDANIGLTSLNLLNHHDGTDPPRRRGSNAFVNTERDGETFRLGSSL